LATLAGGRHIETSEVLTALDALAAGRDPCGVVCGTGFEDQPDFLARLARRWPLLGNDPTTVARIKNPVALAALCRRCRIPHPDTSINPPTTMAGWLAKRVGGAGGSHVCIEVPEQTGTGDFYYQQRVNGTPISALVLANGHSAIILGFSTQWSSPAARQPFR